MVLRWYFSSCVLVGRSAESISWLSCAISLLGHSTASPSNPGIQKLSGTFGSGACTLLKTDSCWCYMCHVKDTSTLLLMQEAPPEAAGTAPAGEVHNAVLRAGPSWELIPHYWFLYGRIRWILRPLCQMPGHTLCNQAPSNSDCSP